MNCPFCKSDNTLPVNSSQNTHWFYCADCRASGPHKTTLQEAADAFTIPVPHTATLRDKLFGGKK